MTGAQLKDIRKSKRLNRKEFGTMFKVSEHTVAKWEQEVNPIPHSVVQLLISSVKLPLGLMDLAEIQLHSAETGLSIDEAVADLIKLGVRAKKSKKAE